MAVLPDLAAYQRFVVAFSGGKDSLASLLVLLDHGVPPDRIELHHHEVDGGGAHLMDWLCTPAYVEALARHFGVVLYRSWRIGGFARELDRDCAPTAPIMFETPEGLCVAGGAGPSSTRGLYPAVSTHADDRAQAGDPIWRLPIMLDRWTLPAGAFGEAGGPT